MKRVSSAQDMRSIGEQLSAILQWGDLVILEGPLGAGKTTLVQGLGAGLGASGRITSPTFVIARVHPARGGGNLVHVDAYRMATLAEIDDLGIDEDLETAVTVVEWGKGTVDQWAEAPLNIRITRSSADVDEAREVYWEADQSAWAQRWNLLTAVLGDSSV